jgi:hypothetical protein
MKQGNSYGTKHSSRASLAPRKKGWVRRHPLISTVAVGGALLAVLRISDCTSQKPQTPESGNRKPDAGLVSKNEDAGSRARKAMGDLRAFLKMRKKFRDAGIRTSWGEEDFDSWREGLADKSVPELRDIWHEYNDIMSDGTANSYPGNRVDWEEAGARAREAKRRRDAAGREIKRRREAGGKY